MENLSELVRNWTDRRFSFNSGYYAGRPPSRSDLNSDILEGFYKGLKKDVSKQAADNFVRFVNKLENLSASSFIVAFERFYHQKCEVVAIAQHPEDQNRITGQGDAAMVQAFAVIGEGMFGQKNGPDAVQRASDVIKLKFIFKHIDVIPEDEQKDFGEAMYEYP